MFSILKLTILDRWLVCEPTSINSLNSPLSLSKEMPLLLARPAFNLCRLKLDKCGVLGPPGLGGTLPCITFFSSISWIWFVNLTIGPNYVFLIFSQFFHIFSHERHWHKKSWAILQNFNSWMIKLTKFAKLPSVKWCFCITVKKLFQGLKFFKIAQLFYEKFEGIERKPILPICQVPNGFFFRVPICKFYHSRIEILQHCSAFFASVSLVRKNLRELRENKKTHNPDLFDHPCFPASL